MGSISYDNQKFFLCPSEGRDSVTMYYLNNTVHATFNLTNINKTQNFNPGDKCLQLPSDNSQTLLCSSNSSLLLWDIPSRNLTGNYTQTFWPRIPDFKPISDTYSSLIVIEDGLIVVLVDILKNQELKVFGGGGPFTRSISMPKSSFLGIHYSFIAKKLIEIWDLSSIVKKFFWNVDLTFCMAINQAQKYYLMGFKGNVLRKWDFLYNINSSVTFSSNNITKIKTINETDGQTKNLLILIADEKFFLYEIASGLVKSTIESYSNPNIDAIDGSYNPNNGLLVLNSNNYFLYNVSGQIIFKTMDVSTNSQILAIFWNTTSNIEFYILYQQASSIFMENWSISSCQPLDIMKDPTFNFKSLIQLPSRNESLLLLLNQNNSFSLFSPYSKQVVKYFPGIQNAVFTSLATISCPKSNIILLNGYLESSTGRKYQLFFLDTNTSKISNALYKTFDTPIKSLLYLNYRDLIAFENGGNIHIFDIMNQNLINSFSHNLGNEFQSMISLKNFPYIIATALGYSITYWNIHEGISSQKYINNFSQIDISIKIHESMTLMNYKTYEILLGSYMNNTSNNQIINFWNISGSNLLFQLIDPRQLYLEYLNFIHVSRGTVDYLIVMTNVSNDIWNLNTQKMESSFFVPKLQTQTLNLQSSDTLIFDINNNTLALWDYGSAITNTDPQGFSFCKQRYFLQSLTNSCESCSELCYSNCFDSLYDSCVTPECNFLFEKSAFVQSSQCFDCSVDNYFTQDSKMCISASNFFTNFDTKTYCFGCLDGFYFSSNDCLPCSGNCKTCYGASINQCLECETNYILYNSLCYEKVENDSLIPLMIVFGIVLGFVVAVLLLLVIKTLIEERFFCLLWKKMWRCLNAIFFDDKFTSTIHRKTIIPPINDQSNGAIMKFQDVELIFPSVTARTATQRTPQSMGNGMDHYNLLINAVNRLKGKILENKELSKANAMKFSQGFIEEVKEEVPFFLYQLIDAEQEFSKTNYFQVKIVKKLCDSAYGPVFLGEKMCKTRFTIKIFMDSIDELNLKKVNKFLFYLNEQDKVKYNTLSKILPVNSLVYTSTKTNFCLGIMEETFDYNLDDFLAKFAKTIHFIQKIDVTLQILDAVKSLHDLNLSHRNIKANNIMINSEDVNYSLSLKINDFSKYMKLSTMLYSLKSPRFNLFQLAYIPPEHFDKKKFMSGSKSGDIWSLGVLIYDIFYPDSSHSLDLPWIRFVEEMTEKYKKDEALGKFNEVFRQELENTTNYCREDPAIRSEITDVINFCLQVRPEKRIPIHELIWKVQWIKIKVSKE